MLMLWLQAAAERLLLEDWEEDCLFELLDQHAAGIRGGSGVPQGGGMELQPLLGARLRMTAAAVQQELQWLI
jgi:hypothetical protein